MNEVDKTIIEMMVDDARVSFRKIASKLQKSTDTVINHYNQLKKTGKIRGSTVVVDIEKIGYEGMASFHIDLESTNVHRANKILDQLITMPNIILATKTVGDHDLLALAVIHNLKHFSKFGQDIAKIEGVKSIKTSIWTGIKEVYPSYFII
jgi:DNA-binding Lrp family transcriptional regulator